MDGNQTPGRHILAAAEQIKAGQITGPLGIRLGISKAIALAERERLPKGAPNISGNLNDISVVRDSFGRIYNEIGRGKLGKDKLKPHYAGAKNEKEGLRFALAMSKASKEHKIGNCTEQAGYVYCKLYKMGYFPIEMVTINKVVQPFKNHMMVAIGLDLEGGDTLDTLTGKDVVICDPWLMLLLESKENKQTDGAYTLDQFVKYIGPYIRDGNRSIKREYRLEHA